MKQENFDQLILKGNLKQNIYEITNESFQELKKMAQAYESEYIKSYQKDNPRVHVEMINNSEFQFSFKFAGDMLVFLMHTNIFEFPRAHDVFKLPYVKEDHDRSYCGIINIYNFLADSFRYNRINDAGYLIGRIFINKDRHYYIEGKHELGLQFNNFSNNVFTSEVMSEVFNSAINYAINFDLLIPPYDNLKEISVLDIQQLEMQSSTIKTAKRMGFKFQSDREELKG